MIFEFLKLKQIGFLTPGIQIFIICVLFVLAIFQQFIEYKKTGKTWGGHFPLKTSSFFAPIFEEVIFRAIILVGLIEIFSTTYAIIISSFLFGLWHLKNIFYFSKNGLIWQIFYTGFIFGPIMAILTLFTGTIWLSVIVHFCNNLLASSTLVRLNFSKKV